MKKRNIAFVAIISLIMSLMPMSVFAGDYGISLNPQNTSVKEGETVTVNARFSLYPPTSGNYSVSCSSSDGTIVKATAELKNEPPASYYYGAEITVEGIKASSALQTITFQLKLDDVVVDEATFDVKVKGSTPITSASATGMTLPTSLTLGKNFVESEINTELTSTSSEPANALTEANQALYVALTDEEAAAVKDPLTLMKVNGTWWIYAYEAGENFEQYKKPVVGKKYATVVAFDCVDDYQFTSSTAININGTACPSGNIVLRANDDGRYDDLFALYEIGTLQADGTFTKAAGVATGDSSDVALFSIFGILALAGAGFVYKRREN